MRGDSGQVPREVKALGIVSLLMDTSSEMIHSLLPVFLTTVLGASPSIVGLVEGIGEGTAAITKVFSGRLSDRIGKRKALAVAGYGLAALSKPLFALAPSAGWILGARVADRIGKGIRGAPRDAMIADFTPPETLGAAYGLRQALDTVGAFAGPLIALLMMQAFPGRFRLVFSIAIVPGLLSALVLALFVREPKQIAPAKKKAEIRRGEVGQLGSGFWRVAAVASLFTLARFSEAFLVLRASGAGLSTAFVPLVLILMNVVYAGSAYPVGVLSDRLGRERLLLPGFAMLIVADLVLGFGSGLFVCMAGIALWGLHMGMTQGVLSAFVADTSPKELRGTAFGIFNLVTGIALLLASLLAGWLWQTAGPAVTFFTGAGLTGAGLLLAGAFGFWKSPTRV